MGTLLEKEILAQQHSQVPPEQLNEIKECFTQFDKDAKGHLIIYELKACLSALGESSVKKASTSSSNSTETLRVVSTSPTSPTSWSPVSLMPTMRTSSASPSLRTPMPSLISSRTSPAMPSLVATTLLPLSALLTLVNPPLPLSFPHLVLCGG